MSGCEYRRTPPNCTKIGTFQVEYVYSRKMQSLSIDKYHLKKITAISTKISDANTRICIRNCCCFVWTAVFLDHPASLLQNSCFSVKEQTLTFLKHKKLLETVNYSWWNVNFNVGVDFWFLVTRILHDVGYAEPSQRCVHVASCKIRVTKNQ